MTTGFDHGQSHRQALRQIVHDLDEEDWLPLDPGDRLWKLYVFRPATDQATQLAHYIYTKQNQGGRLALITFAMHRPAGDRPIRSRIARVPDLSSDALDHIIDAIRHETQMGPDDYMMLDLTHLPALADQLAYLRDLAEAAQSAPD